MRPSAWASWPPTLTTSKSHPARPGPALGWWPRAPTTGRTYQPLCSTVSLLLLPSGLQSKEW